jgi:hypothetical protein
MAQPVVFVPLYNATYATRNVAYTSTAAGSTAPYPAGAQAVAILPSTSAYAIVGKDVVATSANGMPLPAGVTTTLLVPQGDGSPWKVSTIAVSGAGTVYVKPLAKEGI